SLPVAPHPVYRRRSCLQLRTASALSDGDSHPAVGAHSQAHEVSCLQLPGVCKQRSRVRQVLQKRSGEEGLFFYSGQGVILTPAAAKIGKGYVSSRSALRR